MLIIDSKCRFNIVCKSNQALSSKKKRIKIKVLNNHHSWLLHFCASNTCEMWVANKAKELLKNETRPEINYLAF